MRTFAPPAWNWGVLLFRDGGRVVAGARQLRECNVVPKRHGWVWYKYDRFNLRLLQFIGNFIACHASYTCDAMTRHTINEARNEQCTKISTHIRIFNWLVSEPCRAGMGSGKRASLLLCVISSDGAGAAIGCKRPLIVTI